MHDAPARSPLRRSLVITISTLTISLVETFFNNFVFSLSGAAVPISRRRRRGRN